MNAPRHSKDPAAASLRLARRAWKLLHVDSVQALALADRAQATAREAGDAVAEGWARLARGLHRLYHGTPQQAGRELRAARRLLGADRAGVLLADALLARTMWRQGRFRAALDKVLPLRDEGLRVLQRDQRGLLLNTIAGCYSALGRSEEAFAYMYEALRDLGPRQGRGFDVVLHNNLAHELQQIGDYDEALRHVEEGLARSQDLVNPRLRHVLRVNRVICLTELGRAAEALPDVRDLRAQADSGAAGGWMAAYAETMAIAALRAGDLALGADLVACADAEGEPSLPDEQLERATARALLALARGRPGVALRVLLPWASVAAEGSLDGLSVRVRAQFLDVLVQAQQRARRPAAALASLTTWQRLHREQAQLASRARYQAAALQTELLRLQHRLDDQATKRRATERARNALAAANAELERRMAQVQALQDALRQQATQDPLTGLFNRRHLNDTLPTLFALARRERQPLALAIIDLDRFKSVNDRHGHAAGDRLLMAFGEMLAAHCRASDVACRYGGEEFCLLMPRTDASGAQRKVRSLLRRWRARSFDLDGGTLEAPSFTAGVTDSLRHPASADALLQAADERLLQAKREGRNQVVVAAA